MTSVTDPSTSGAATEEDHDVQIPFEPYICAHGEEGGDKNLKIFLKNEMACIFVGK